MKAKLNRVNSNIGWSAWSWCPVTGCKMGCEYCYARKMAERFHQSFEPTFHPEKLEAPKNTKIPKGINNRVFVCSTAELFAPWIPDEWICQVFDVVHANPQWTFLFLTKCPERLPYLQWPKNAWIGATIDQNERIKRTTSAFLTLKRSGIKNKLFISCEPLLEGLFLPTALWDVLDWVIMGALSEGRVKVQPYTYWVENLLTWARSRNVPVWMKDNLIFRPQEIPR